MIPRISFQGLETASAKLSEEMKKVGQQNSEKFVTLSLKSIEAAAMPYVPVGDTSLLINSAYTTVAKLAGSGYYGYFGYGAEYAGYVHEGGPKNWQKAGASDQFLLKGVDDFIEETLDRLLSVLGE